MVVRQNPASFPQLQWEVCGLVVECFVAIEAARVRFPADAATEFAYSVSLSRSELSN